MNARSLFARLALALSLFPAALAAAQGQPPPKKPSLRADPFQRAAHEGIGYPKWRIDRVFLLVPAQQYVAQFLATFKEFPPSQKVGTFSMDQVMEMLSQGAGK
ncbi:MAG: hypothetical protein JNM86_08670 [Phycisphaerae bacterium]|nr:hypothetical protein [Phycisphaerae bacterium]